MNILLVGFCVSPDYFERYTAGDALPQVAAYKLESRFLRALRIGGARVRTISTAAVSTYPRNPHVLLPSQTGQAQDGRGARVLPLINLPVLKLASRFLGVLTALISQPRSEKPVVCLYSAHTPNLLAAYLYSTFVSAPFFVYVPDLPVYMDMGLNRSLPVKWLKRLDVKLVDAMLARASGVFVAAKPMAEDSSAWAHVPALVVEGICDDSVAVDVEYPASLPDCSGKKIIFYAGSVNRAYGIVELVEAFKRAGSSYELWLCGRGDLEDYLRSQSQDCAAIKYLGFVPPAHAQAIQQRASLLALTRDPAEKYTRYSFPSKILEYMASGVPVMTTKLDGVPAEYDAYLNLIEEFSVDCIARTIERLDRMDETVLLRKADDARDWLLREKTSGAVGARIVRFVEANCERISR
ncbi:glycosyltransferase [Halopseudomonas nanhaiensis]|uniref:glycosyltransferase n=1 Tax=Halopseudomonas nanhaiensis TaxID=2830842 RepID=UPI001CBDF259|nr:glycosyltransferase [Halopseudomonas nanhaiensis]UAW99466.1 glycosyltransferase [Halopseudomonas nanhaiensis]